MTTRELIDDFLKQKRIALIGVSRKEKSYSRELFREFIKRGYNAVPVNPRAKELEGEKCIARVQDINPAADGALILTPKRETEQIVRDCIKAGIFRLWLPMNIGSYFRRKANPEFTKNEQVKIITGYCPFMFLPEPMFFHRFHGFILKLVGKYPK